MVKKRKNIVASMSDVACVSSVVGNRVDYGLMGQDEELRYLADQGEFSNRTDYGRKINIKIPQGYHAQAKKSWEMYSTDRLFKYLIDRCIDYGANGFEWEVSSDILSKKPDKKIEREKKFWDTWATKINNGVSNVIPGIDEINKWIIKQLLIGGMAPLEWEWGKIKIDEKMYEVPLRLTVHNVLSTLLERTNDIFLNEKVSIKLNKQIIGTPTSGLGKNPIDWHEMPLLGSKKPNKKLEGFVIKYNWTPGDNTSTTVNIPNMSTTGYGLYPQPPFYGLNEILLMRRQLCAADIAILDGIINYIVEWSIGDNEKDGDGNLIHEPKPAKYNASGQKTEKSTIETIKEMITTENRANVMQLFLPYYVKLNIRMPDTSVLINADKYVQSTVEMFMAFGIALSPTDRRVDFTEINISNFEQMVDNIRLRHIKRFWETLCAEIVERNNLSSVPNMIFNPLNTQDEKFRAGLLSLAKIGRVSLDSLLKAHKLDKKTELQRIAREVHTGEKSLTDQNVPVSFVQQTVDKNDKKTIGRSATKDGGRPQKEGEESGKEEKTED